MFTEADLQANFTKISNQGLNEGKLVVSNPGKDVYREQ